MPRAFSKESAVDFAVSRACTGRGLERFRNGLPSAGHGDPQVVARDLKARVQFKHFKAKGASGSYVIERSDGRKQAALKSMASQ
jgi:hypothetical protein